MSLVSVMLLHVAICLRKSPSHPGRGLKDVINTMVTHFIHSFYEIRANLLKVDKRVATPYNIAYLQELVRNDL